MSVARTITVSLSVIEHKTQIYLASHKAQMKIRFLVNCIIQNKNNSCLSVKLDIFALKDVSVNERQSIYYTRLPKKINKT